MGKSRLNKFYAGITITALIALSFSIVFIYLSSLSLENELETYIENKIEVGKDFLEIYPKQDKIPKLNFPVFCFKGDSLVYWNQSGFIPSSFYPTSKGNTYKYQSGNSQFYISTLKKDPYTLISIIPIIADRTFLPISTRLFSLKAPKTPLLNLEDGISFDLNNIENSKINPWVFWIYLFFSLIASFLIGHGIFESYSLGQNKFQILDKTALSLLMVCVFLVPTTFLPVFNAYWLSADLLDSYPGGLNLVILFSILIFSFYLLSRISQLKINIKALGQGSFKHYLKGIGGYLIIVLAGIITLFFIEQLFTSSGSTLALEQLDTLSGKDIIFLMLYLILFSNFLIFSQLVYKYIHLQKLNIVQKLVGILFGIILLFLANLSGMIDFPLVPLFLSFLIFIMLLDLFQDRRHIDSTWVITWMILISSLLSLILFEVDLRSDQTRISKTLNLIIQKRDQSLEKALSTNDSLVNNLSSKYAESGLHVNDEFSKNWKRNSIKITDDLFFNPLSGTYLLLVQRGDKDSIQYKFYTKLEKTSIQDQVKIDGNIALFHHGSLKINQLEENLNPERFLKQTREVGNWYHIGGRSLIRLNYHSGISLLYERKFPGLLRPVSLFSLLFFILSIVLFLFSTINTFFKFIPEQLTLEFFDKRSLRNRIQISIISLIILSFIIMGFISNYYLQQLATETTKSSFLNEAKLIEKDIQGQIASNAATDQFLLATFYSKNQMVINGKNLLLFDGAGESISEENVIAQQGLSQMNVLPMEVFHDFNKIKNKRFSWFTKDLKKGVFFNISNNAKQKVLAFLPADQDLTSSLKISDVLAGFLSIYTILFILSGMLAIMLSNSITKPIDILGKKLKSLKLSDKNETVQWSNEDEIGTLISIYNEMIHKLSDNAKVMAKVERDAAWKEMAKQVAHEIKNPLTPLKLNIQYLESKVRMNPEEAGTLIGQIAPSLIEQIENLSQIASEFSNFAQLPSARNEKVRLNEIVKTVHDFFRKREDLDFQLFLPIDDVLVFADKNHLVRILNNVVKNAIQSIPTDRAGEIIIRLYRKAENAIIQVSDNGSGIAEEMKDKVFSPNFTTKSSGTGLGLAISTNMLESFNGSIYFETKVNIGTDFFIEVPLMRLEDNYPGTEKVLLDD